MLNPAVTKEKSKQLKQTKLGIETILSLVAITLITSIFFKAILDIDNNYDPGWYHLPFAGRLGGILPREMFMGDEKWFEPRFDGFPLLAHFLQGFFWRITGRIQSTNLVGFLSIFGYFFFLKSFFKVPLYLSAIALFSIPLVLTHATSSFVDLFGNIGISILVMMTYSFYNHQQLPNIKELLIFLFGAAIAANTKTQLQPLVFVILLVAGIRLAWLYWRHQPPVKLAKIIPITLIASLIIFASPVKNTILYANPLYPIKVQIGGMVLNHKLSPEAYEGGNRQLNWIQSVLEIKAPLLWTPDQWSTDLERNRKGGFWGTYVIFNLLLLVGFALREAIVNKSLPNNKSSEAKVALFSAIAMSLVPLNFPQSHELRYFMYWMICLVSLNLYLVSLPKNRQMIGKWLQPKYLGLVYTLFLIIVLVKVGKLYAQPSLITLDKYLALGVKSEFVEQIQPNEKVCLLSRHIGEDTQTAPTAALKYAFLYSSYFHPELNYDYSIQAALNPEACGDRIIIPSKL
jgi:hypothetical protein